MHLVGILLAYLVGMIIVGVVSYYATLILISRFDIFADFIVLGGALTAISFMASLAVLLCIAIAALSGWFSINQTFLNIVLTWFSVNVGLTILAIQTTEAFNRAVRISI